jgi:hypothetical protein
VHTGFWWRDLREGDHLGDPGVDGRIILKGSSRRGLGVCWVELAQDRDRWQALVKGGNEPPGSIKCGEFLD